MCYKIVFQPQCDINSAWKEQTTDHVSILAMAMSFGRYAWSNFDFFCINLQILMKYFKDVLTLSLGINNATFFLLLISYFIIGLWQLGVTW